MHLKGLSHIIKLRGGVDKIGNQGGLYMFLQMWVQEPRIFDMLLTGSRLDLIHAVYFHTSPMYTSAEESQPGSKQNTPRSKSYDATIDNLNQETLDEISDFITSIPEMDNAPTDTANVIPDYLSLQEEPVLTPSTFEIEVQQWHEFLVQAAQNIAPSYEGSLAYACDLAAGLHLATTSAVMPHPKRLQGQTNELFNTMAGLPDDAWDSFHMLHVRM